MLLNGISIEEQDFIRPAPAGGHHIKYDNCVGNKINNTEAIIHLLPKKKILFVEQFNLISDKMVHKFKRNNLL